MVCDSSCILNVAAERSAAAPLSLTPGRRHSTVQICTRKEPNDLISYLPMANGPRNELHQSGENSEKR